MFNSGYLISRSASIPENILLVYIPIVLTRAFGIGRPVFRYVERLTSHNWVLRMTSYPKLISANDFPYGDCLVIVYFSDYRIRVLFVRICIGNVAVVGNKCVCAAALVRCDQWRSSRKAKTNEESIIYNID